MFTVVRIVSLVFQAYQFLILIRVLLSWVNVNPYGRAINHPLIDLLYRLTDPVLEPLRRLIPPIGGMLDISPIVAMILLEVVRQVIVRLLLSF
ncbi:MAG: YggT family protein [Anaerolineae bacterium]|nr:YggT family protein [Anaerolineae bacterium]MDX9833477.1 YggT family protein [Anaerolineae bacterium]MDX9833516.1 YggT family protein [Anaerolineae bacterium]